MATTANRKTILLVEDNPLDLELTLRAFRVCGLDNPIDVARDGQEVLDYMEQASQQHTLPSLVLLDLNLPKLSGLEVLRELKQNPKFRTVPVILLTSSSETSDVEQAYALGVNSYVVKPVDYDLFMDLLRAINAYWNSYNLTPQERP